MVVVVVHFDVDVNVDVAGGLITAPFSPHFCLYAAKRKFLVASFKTRMMKCKVFVHFVFSRKHQYLSRFTTDLHVINRRLAEAPLCVRMRRSKSGVAPRFLYPRSGMAEGLKLAENEPEPPGVL